ncbi:hypothetical protein O0L34_g4204 [Tuta absoluta]|nr:hypothetical protein O0L34_g4204 [Tuta absoluta]
MYSYININNMLEKEESLGSISTPGSSPFQQVPATETYPRDSPLDNSWNNPDHPYLKIIVEPQEQFRFRYIKEIDESSHGYLQGESSSTMVKTFPTVQLRNYNGEAVIKCQLYQHDKDIEHPHRLFCKSTENQPVAQVSAAKDYTVPFEFLGIIHTAKREQKAQLYQRLENSMGSDEFEQLDMKQLKNLCNKIDSERVRLRFSAHDPLTDKELCSVFSRIIYHKKLRICRSLPFSGRASGGDEVMLFVEKVNKDILVNLFEENSEGIRVWEAEAHIVQIHHGHGICIRTPRYTYKREEEMSKPVDVWIELVLKSHSRRSDPVRFRYKPEPHHLLRKRARISTSAMYEVLPNAILIEKPAQPDLLMLPLDGNRSFPAGMILANNNPSAQSPGMILANNNPSAQSPGMILANNNPSAQSPGMILANNNPSAQSAGMILANNNPSAQSAGMILANNNPSAQSAGMLLANNNPSAQSAAELFHTFDLSESGPEMPMELLNQAFNEAPTADTPDYNEFLTKVLPDLMDKYIPLLAEDDPFMGAQRIVSDKPHPGNRSKPYILCSTDGGDNPELGDEEDKEETHEDRGALLLEDLIEIQTLITDILDLKEKKLREWHIEVTEKIERLFEMRMANGDTILHVLLNNNEAVLTRLSELASKLGRADLLSQQRAGDGLTVLHLATAAQQTGLQAALLQQGCDPLCGDWSGNNVIHYAVICGGHTLKPLLDAVFEQCGRDKKKMDWMLRQTNYDGQTPIWLAVDRQCVNSLQLLLEYCDLEKGLEECQGRSPLQLAVEHDRPDILKMLLEATARGASCLNACLRATAALPARDTTHEIVAMLRDHGADPLPVDVEKDVASDSDDDYYSADEGDSDESEDDIVKNLQAVNL